MSDSESSNGDSGNGLLGKVTDENGDISMQKIRSSIRDLITDLQSEFDSDSARGKYEDGRYGGPITLASNQEVADEAIREIRDLHQRLKAEELGISDEKRIKRIEIDKDLPQEYQKLLKEFDNILAQVRGTIVDELHRRQQGDEKNPMVDSEEEIMTYLISENAGEYEDVTLLGGGKALVYNLCDKFGYTDDEREFILKAHEIAADKNGYERHTLVDSFLVVPQFQHKDIDVTEEE